MSTITTLVGTNGITTADSMAKINTNFSNLNTDKIETSVLDIDDTLAANSDAKIPSQKAVKAYVDAGGNVNASETTRGIVEEATDAEVTAGTSTGGTGAKLVVTPAKLATKLTSYVSIFKNGLTTHDISTTGDQTIAHGLGVIPKMIRVSTSLYGINCISHSYGTYDGTTNSNISTAICSTWSSSEANGSTVYIIFLRSDQLSGAKYAYAVATFDATNITLTWSKTSTPTGTVYINWEAEA